MQAASSLDSAEVADGGPAPGLEVEEVLRLRRWSGVGRAVVLLLCPVLLSGCFSFSSAGATMRVVDHRSDGRSARYTEYFQEAYYSIDAQDVLDVVLRTVEPARSVASGAVTQWLHIRTVWTSRPGFTTAERTQINGTIVYQLISPGSIRTYEGAGSVFFEEKDGDATGMVEYAVLRPVGPREEEPLFEHAEIHLTFTARRDRRRVVRMMNEIQARAAAAR